MVLTELEKSSDIDLHIMCQQYASLRKHVLEPSIILDSAKMRHLANLLQEELLPNGHRVLIFSQERNLRRGAPDCHHEGNVERRDCGESEANHSQGDELSSASSLSQFLLCLDLLELLMQHLGLSYRRFDGSHSASLRQARAHRTCVFNGPLSHLPCLVMVAV